MNQKNTQTLWCLHRYFKPHIKRWGEECVLFDEASGDTHIIDSLAGFVLENLSAGSATVDALSSALVTDDEYLLEEKKAMLADVLGELKQLKFVEEVAV